MANLDLAGIITRVCSDLKSKFSKVSVTPSLTSGTKSATVTVDGTDYDLYAPASYELPPATASTLGGVKVGDGLSVAVDGTLSSTGMVILEYGVSTWAECLEAIEANRVVYCKVPSNSTNSRMAFLAWRESSKFEFQYYRSISSHTDSQQGDEIYIYTLKNDNSWTTVTRQASTRVVAGDGLSSSYSNGTITLNAVGGGSGGIADGSVTTAKLADGAVTITKLSDEANALKEVFAGLHIEKSQQYSGYVTVKAPVYIPKGSICKFTNTGDKASTFGVDYATLGSTEFVNNFPIGATYRFIAQEDIKKVWQYMDNSTLNSFTFEAEPMWLGAQVSDLEQRFMPNNLFDKDAEGVVSGWINTGNGTINSDGSYSTSDYIPIEVGKTYSHPAAVSLYGISGAKRVPCFDAEKNWVGYFNGTIDANNILTFTVPSRLDGGTSGGYRYDHVYARFTYSNASNGSIMFVEGAQPSEYVAYGAGKLATGYGLNQKQKDEIVELVGDSASPLYGKKIAYNGDSICESRLNTSSLAYNGGAYAKIISDITGCTYENRAHSGGILASATGDGTTAARYVVSDVENMASDADLICFEGGINDYWTKVPLGTYSESDYTGTLDTTTICGAIESIFRQATAKWAGKPICFVIVHKIKSTVYTQNTQGYTFKDAHDMMLGICKKYAIPVFDAFEESGLNAYNSIQNTNFLTANANGTPDGCHPNEAGYRAFYVPQLIALFESLIART